MGKVKRSSQTGIPTSVITQTESQKIMESIIGRTEIASRGTLKTASVMDLEPGRSQRIQTHMMENM